VVSRSNRVFPVTNRVFIKDENLLTFESALLNYTDKLCPNMTANDTMSMHKRVRTHSHARTLQNR
jgi:hypothetical protein